MFVAHDVAFGVPFATARPRLTDLLASRALGQRVPCGLRRRARPRGPRPAQPGPPDAGPLASARARRGPGDGRTALGGRRPGGGALPGARRRCHPGPRRPRGQPGWSWPASTVSRSLICTTIPVAITGRLAETTVRALLHAMAGYLSGHPALAGRRAVSPRLLTHSDRMPQSGVAGDSSATAPSSPARLAPGYQAGADGRVAHGLMPGLVPAPRYGHPGSAERCRVADAPAAAG